MSGLIVGADKWICLSPIAKVILFSNMHHWGMGKKANKESLKRVWKALQKTEKTQGMQYSEAGALLADRQRVLVTAHHSPAAAATAHLLPSWRKVLGSPGTAFPPALLLLLPTEGGGTGDTCSWLRGGSRRCASLWEWPLPWGDRQPICGSESLESYFKMSIIPFFQ